MKRYKYWLLGWGGFFMMAGCNRSPHPIITKYTQQLDCQGVSISPRTHHQFGTVDTSISYLQVQVLNSKKLNSTLSYDSLKARSYQFACSMLKDIEQTKNKEGLSLEGISGVQINLLDRKIAKENVQQFFFSMDTLQLTQY